MMHQVYTRSTKKLTGPQGAEFIIFPSVAGNEAACGIPMCGTRKKKTFRFFLFVSEFEQYFWLKSICFFPTFTSIIMSL